MRHRNYFRSLSLSVGVLLQALAWQACAMSAPEGFRGMKWGDPVSRLPNAASVSYPPGCYINRREDLRLADAPLFGVYYCFEKEKLQRVELRSATGEDNLKAFQEAVFTIFGDPLPLAPGTNRNIRSFTPADAPVSVTLIREVLGVHKYLLVLERREIAAPVGEPGAAGKENEAKKDFGF